MLAQGCGLFSVPLDVITSPSHHNGAMVAALLTSLLNELHKLPPWAVYLVAGSLTFGEAGLFIGFVIPGETAVLVAGAIASKGGVSITALTIEVVLCAIVGDSVGYYVGERWGHHLLKLPIVRHRRALIELALDGLRRRGPMYVFLGRWTAFLRAVMPGLAGMSKLAYGKFLIANALGGIAWGITFTLIGYYAGHALDRVEKTAGWMGLGLLGLIILAVLSRHVITKRREAALEAAYEREHPDVV